MNFEEAERKFEELRQAYKAGKVTPEQFMEHCAKLRLSTPDGTWWQIDPDTGAWRKWDGSQWILAEPPRAPSAAKMPPPPATSQSQPPARPTAPVKLPMATAVSAKKTGPLWQQIVIWICIRLVMMALTFGTAWILHIYLVGWINNGTVKYDLPVSRWINVLGNKQSALGIWFMISGLFWSIVVGCFTAGPAKTLLALVNAPVRFITILRKTKIIGLGSLAAGAGIALVAAGILKFNPQAGAATFVTWIFLALGYPGYLVARAISSVTGFTAKLVKAANLFGLDAAQGLVASIAIGFLIAVAIKGGWAIALGIILILGGIGLWIQPWRWLEKGSTHIGQATVFLLAGSFIAVVYALIDILIPHPAYAHDGGWIEFKDANPDASVLDYLRDGATRSAIAATTEVARSAMFGALMPSYAGDVAGGVTKLLTADDVMNLLRSGSLTMDQLRQLADALQAGVLGGFYTSTSLPEGIAVAGAAAPPSFWQINEKLREVADGRPMTDAEAHEWAGKQRQSQNAAEGFRWYRAIVAGALVLAATWEVSPIPAIVTAVVVGLEDKIPPDVPGVYTETMAGQGTLADRVNQWEASLPWYRRWFEPTPTTQEGWYDKYVGQSDARQDQDLAHSNDGTYEDWANSEDRRALDNEVKQLRDIVGEDYIRSRVFNR